MADDRLQYYTQAMTIDPETDKPMPKVATSASAGYDVAEDMFKVKSTQKKWKTDFAGTSLDSTKWETVQQGAGHTISVLNGELTIATGTTINTETILLSRETFTIPFRSLFGFMISQKIANQEFHMELVSIDPVTGLVDDKNIAGWKIAQADSATNDYAKYRVGASGITVQESPAVDTNVAQTAYGIYEIEAFADECWFHARPMDSPAGRSYSNVKHQNIPHPNGVYKVRLRAKNLATAPASSTNFKFQFVNVVDYAELTAEITAGRGNVAQGQAIAVQFPAAQQVTVSGNPAVVGNVAHDTAQSGNPVRTAGVGRTTNYTAVADNDVANFVTTVVGAQIEKPYSIPELDWQVAPAAIAVTTDQVMKAAGAAGIRNYMTAINMKNVGATATEVVVKDGATVIWRNYLPANMVTADTFNFPTPLRGTAATAMNFAALTAGANIYMSAQGYQAP